MSTKPENNIQCRLWGHDHGTAWLTGRISYECRICSRPLGGDPKTRYSGCLGAFLVALVLFGTIATLFLLTRGAAG